MVLIQGIEENMGFACFFGRAEGKAICSLSVCRCLKIKMKGNLFLIQHVVKTGICNFVIDCLITNPYDIH